MAGCLFYFACGGKLQTIGNTYLLEYFWLNGGMLSGGSVWLSTGLRVWVVSVYSYGVKSLVRGVWLALWRLAFVFLFGVCFCVFGLAWVALVWLGLAWVRLGRLENLLKLRSCQDSRIGYKLSWFYAFLIGEALFENMCFEMLSFGFCFVEKIIVFRDAFFWFLFCRENNCVSRCFLLVFVLSRK